MNPLTRRSDNGRPAPGPALSPVLVLGAAAGVALLIAWWYQHREHSQDEPILAAARRHDVDPALVKAVVWRESWFNPLARGRRGELGLMQIRATTAQEWARAERLPSFQPEWLFNSATNTVAGAWYLSRLLRRYAQTDDPTAYALADYNAGRSNVLRWTKGAAATNSAVFLRQIDFGSTRRYVRAVLKRQARYQRQKFGAR
ncbi:MAG: lytic transglycosylase domain-containing protein [Verrucomicrobia bacterium]|nr:lytic transglycosylase domain-containing protein [Verrucomicrobiota bacterium]